MTFIDFVCLGVPLGLVSGGLVFFDRRKRNLGGACSRVPAEDSDGERAHYKENQAGRGRAGGVHEGHCDDRNSLRGAQDSAHEEEDPDGLVAGVPCVRANRDLAQIQAEGRAYGLVADQESGHEEVEAGNDNDECGANQKDSDQDVHVFPLDCSRLAGSKGVEIVRRVGRGLAE